MKNYSVTIFGENTHTFIVKAINIKSAKHFAQSQKRLCKYKGITTVRLKKEN